MAKNLSLSGIQTGQAIEAKHVTQSINAFTGVEAYDITVSGSLTVQGPVQGTAGTLNNFSSSYALTASYALNGGSGGGGGGSVGTLQQVMESGSSTTLVITASVGISSSGAIISPSFTGSLSGSALEAISASFAQTASYALNAVSSSYALTASHALDAVGFPFSGSAVITGSLVISSSNQEQSLQLYGSGSTIFSIEGSRGTLFSIDDDESDGKLFSVNNVSGTPVLEVHEDNTVKLGKQNGFGIIISGSNPLPNDADAKILVTGSIYHSGSNVYFNAPLTASSFRATPGVINQLTASYAISASVEVTKEISSSHADRADTASYVETAQTASYVLNAVSSSYALTASHALNSDPFPYTGSALITNALTLGTNLSDFDSTLIVTGSAITTGNITTKGSISASGLIFGRLEETDTSGLKVVVYDPVGGGLFRTGSYNSGGGAGFPFSGSADITGSLLVSGSFVNFTDAPLTASIISASSGITGSLLGTASTASYVETAQTASFVTLAQTASFITTAQTASYVLASNIDQPFTDITASGNISASGHISASNLDISGSATINGPLTLTQTNTLSPLTINNGTGTEINFPGALETNITSEGLFQFKTSNNQGYGFGVNNTDFKAVIGAEGLATTATTIIADTYNGRLILRGNASPNQISGSLAITGSAGVPGFISIEGNITASGNISASGDVITKKVGIIDGAGLGLGFEGGGNENSDVQLFTDAAGEINFIKNSVQALAINSANQVRVRNSYNLVVDQNISASGYISASSFNATPGTINELTASHAMNVQLENNFMPVTTHTTNFTSTSSYAGHYNIVGGNLSITVTTGSTPTDLTPGMEWNFFQTSSGNNFTFTAGTGINLVSRNMHTKLAAIGSAGTLKYISDQTFHLIGDLTL